MKKHNKSESGQAIILIVFAIIGLIGMTGLTVDGGFAYSDRRNAQNAADTAALAAGRSMIREEGWEQAGLDLAAANGYENDGINTVDVIWPHPDLGDEYIQVIIVSHVQTSFARVVGINEMTNTVNAVARVIPSTYVNMFDGNAVVSLNPGGCKAFSYQGNSSTTVTGGGLFVNSDCDENGNQKAFFNQSNSPGNSLTAPSLCTVGGYTYNNGAVDIPSENIKKGEENCSSYAYPLDKYVMPLPDCGGTGSSTYDTSTEIYTLTPGEYSGTFPPDNGHSYMEPGVYCVDGAFRLNGTDILEGSDVVIYMEDGDVQWNGGSTVILDAPNEGPFKGLLLYMPYENSNPLTLNGSGDASQLSGTILAPASDIQINGAGDGGINGQVIGYEVTLGGGSDVTINYSNEENYEAKTPPYLELTE